MVEQLCNYTKNYSILYLKQVNVMVYRLYLNEVLKINEASIQFKMVKNSNKTNP